MNLVMPMILQNLHSGDEHRLKALQKRAQAAEGPEKEQAMRRRMSIAAVQTSDDSTRPASAAVTGTADDADRIAEEEVGLLALQCLKQLFVANNRVQVRLATSAMLKFICSKAASKRPSTGRSIRTSAGASGTWATGLIEMVTMWAPVQDRFVILVTVMEALVRSPIAEENMEQQLLLVSLVDWLLRSSINMIGLSVMDVLLGLVQHILLLLQLGGKGSNVLPHHQQTDAIDLFKDTETVIEGPISPKEGVKDETLPSSNRQELLTRLHRCIGDLATHIYYSDQISDIISAILLRLKPSSMSNVSSTTAAIEHPEAAIKAISASVQLQDKSDTHEFFSFGTARVTALKAIKEVLIVANTRSSVNGAAAIGRNRVNVQVWEGTQWLLRDEDRRVRRAYVDALLTWLKLEMSSNDLRVLEDKRKLTRPASKNDVRSTRSERMSKRAVSNASQRGREQPVKPAKSNFLQMLHLAVYDNALESPESEPDLLLLHLLLHQLVEKLGVNAVKTGLPMILRLQEDINLDEVIGTPTAKMNVGCLVHGYLWTLTEKFDFDASTVGYVVQSEILRRKKHGLWLDNIRVPPIPLDHIIPATTKLLSDKPSLPELQSESIKPFDSRTAIVERIAESYANAVASPPTSPPSSPGRVFSMPILSGNGPAPTKSNELPSRIKDTMMSEWSKEICIATVEKESTRTVSLNGSRKGGNLSQYLGVNGRNGSPSNDQSPARGVLPTDNNITTQPNALNFAISKNRRSSAQDTEAPTPNSSTDQNTTLRVDDLKRVLAGETINTRGASPLRHSTHRNDIRAPLSSRSLSPDTESITSASGFESASEGDLSRPLPPPAPNHLPDPTATTKTLTIMKPPPTTTTTSPHTPTSATHSRNPSSSQHVRSRPQSGDHSHPPSTPRSLRRPSTSSSAAGEDPDLNAAALRGEMPRLSADMQEEVPPVPPLPAGIPPVPARPLSGTTSQGYGYGYGGGHGGAGAGAGAGAGGEAKEKDRGSKRSSASGKKRGVDVGALLGSIDAVTGPGQGQGRLGLGRPPY